jgi:pentose-5-phosphate-3-epimerase
MIITPAILPRSFEDLHAHLFLIEGVSYRVQIDICDGVAGLEKTWLPYQEKDLPHGFEYEFDVMVRDWQKMVLRAISLKAKRIVIHSDTWADYDFAVLEDIAKNNPQVIFGFACSNTTDLQKLARYSTLFDRRYGKTFIQVMGIAHVGAQGQPFDDGSLSRIEFFKRTCPHIPIQVDGSMNPETIFLVKRSGATGVVVGSYIFGSRNARKVIDSLHVKFGE